jgi:hypothetical protein
VPGLLRDENAVGRENEEAALQAHDGERDATNPEIDATSLVAGSEGRLVAQDSGIEAPLVVPLEENTSQEGPPRRRNPRRRK